MNPNRIVSLTLAALIPALLCGCFQVGYKARGSKGVPLMTADPGRPVAKAGRFERKSTSVWLLYGNVPVHAPAGGGSRWAADAIAKEVAKRKGDAAVNVRFQSHIALLDFITGFIPFGLLSTNTDSIQGEVVRFKEEPPAPPPVATPQPAIEEKPVAPSRTKAKPASKAPAKRGGAKK